MRRMNIRNCVRCRGDHDNVEFKDITNPSPGCQEWASCPTSGEPIILSTGGDVPLTISSMGGEPIEKPVPLPEPPTQVKKQPEELPLRANLGRMMKQPTPSKVVTPRPTKPIPSIRDLDL